MIEHERPCRAEQTIADLVNYRPFCAVGEWVGEQSRHQANTLSEAVCFERGPTPRHRFDTVGAVECVESLSIRAIFVAGRCRNPLSELPPTRGFTL